MSMKGRENAYRCPECGGYTSTIDIDDGVTPMFLACRASGDLDGCQGMAQSCMYPAAPRPPHIPTPAWEFYRPNEREAVELDRETFEHVARGGLLLRKRAT